MQIIQWHSILMWFSWILKQEVTDKHEEHWKAVLWSCSGQVKDIWLFCSCSSDEPGLNKDQGLGLQRQNGVGTVISIRKLLRGCISQGMGGENWKYQSQAPMLVSVWLCAL